MLMRHSPITFVSLPPVVRASQLCQKQYEAAVPAEIQVTRDFEMCESIFKELRKSESVSSSLT